MTWDEIEAVFGADVVIKFDYPVKQFRLHSFPYSKTSHRSGQQKVAICSGEVEEEVDTAQTFKGSE